VASPLTRSAVVALSLSLLLGGVGAGWELARFGLDTAATSAHLESEVRRKVADEIRTVESLGRRVAGEAALVGDATADRDELPRLFARLFELAAPVGASRTSVTVYVPTGPAGGYRVLAWSAGPAEDLASDRLSGPAALFVAPGTVGLRLVFVQPMEDGGRRVGVAAAESVLSPVSEMRVGEAFHLDTSYGAVEIIPRFAGAGESQSVTNGFLITGSNGAPLLEVHYSPADLEAGRQRFWRGVVVAAALPLVALLLLSTGAVISRRRGIAAGRWWRLTAAAAGLLLAGAAALAGLARFAGAPSSDVDVITALAVLALVTLMPVSWWWRRRTRRAPTAPRWQFGLEHLGVGVILAASVMALRALLESRITPASLQQWELPLFPVDLAALMYLAGVFVAQVAVCWAVAAVMAIIAARWRLSWRRPLRSLPAVALWLTPTLVVAASPAWFPDVPSAGAVGLALAASAFALAAQALRTSYRHTTQAMRMVLIYAALLVPPAAAYPMAAAIADATTRALIERDYAPATARHPQELREALVRTEAEIDRIPSLDALVSTAGPADTSVAFRVWNQTELARTRVTSAIELYGADRGLVSRFTLNVPEYVYRAGSSRWTGASCAWDLFGEVTKFGAEDREMLHAERGICDAAGRIIGAVVVHVIRPDYQALPFVSSANPYYDLLGGARSAPGGSYLPDLQLAIYGWSLQVVFTSNQIAWPISADVFRRLYTSRDPFWTTAEAESRAYQVYFTSDRARVYALGYPVPTLFEHATRLAEVAAVTGGLFVLLLLGTSIWAPLARQAHPPLRVLFDEVRTSFYRKLFLFFVLAAVGPVLLFALAFGAYTTARSRADVVSEATNVVAVAQRVFGELAAAEQHPAQPPPPPSDAVMVWIRQVIDQDVNLFEGADLVATSQRDLFDSGLLPTRTPAALYRAIALERLPAFVTEDRLGAFPYLLAAAPVPTRGREFVLSVPLAPRQREIERQIDELNRGVLVGAVLVVLFAAGLGASVAGRVSDPVARLTRATRLIAAGRLDVRITADTADELRRLVDDFNSMAETLLAQRAELAHTHQVKAWAEMARQVAHEIKNPLTPIQLAAEHLQRVHDDRGQPLGPVVDQCVVMILRQVKLLRQIASEFSTFAGQATPRLESSPLPEVIESVVAPYRLGLDGRIQIDVETSDALPRVTIDRTLFARALTNLVENAVQAMPGGGRLRVTARAAASTVTVIVEDTGVGMDEEAARRAFEPYFSTKTAGSGLGLANARRNIELCGGTIDLSSVPGRGTRVTISLPRPGAPGAIAGG
jgi:signal transduction histidine kinase